MRSSYFNRIFAILLCVSLLCGLCSCGSGSSASERDNSNTSNVNEVIESGIAASENVNDADSGNESEAGTSADSDEQETDDITEPVDSAGTNDQEVDVESESGNSADSNDQEVDVDLTVMSSTMVFAEVSSMIQEPDPFIGKSIKMAGQFAIYEDVSTGNVYCACIVQDATACCQNGIEFVLEGEPEYPFGYPEIGEEITVTGIFDTYEENGFYYITLRDAHLL